MNSLPSLTWSCRGRSIPIGRRTLVMGILNVTPDSFSDGGRFLDPTQALAHALQMEQDGADILDLGAESTRPGSASVPPEEQVRRLRGVMESLRDATRCLISIDTTSAEVAREMIHLGADIINDISALRADPEMAQTIAKSGAGCVLMHMLGTPQTMQVNPRYKDVVTEVRDFLKARIAFACNAGISPEQIAIDPGIGFGKTVEHNLQIIKGMPALSQLQRPILSGPSRKSFIGQVLYTNVDDRLEGTLAAVAASVLNGAAIVRVHDVKPVRRLVDMLDAIQAVSPA